MTGSTLNIYCDESCHLLNDHNTIMSLGAITAPIEDSRTFSRQIKELKDRHSCTGELKWTKVSPKNLPFYSALLDYYFNNPLIGFRSLIVSNKQILDHQKYNDGDHNTFYYKMYYYLIKNLVENKSGQAIRIYIDIKDTKSGEKVHRLHEVLSSTFYDFQLEKIQRLQQIRSNESELMQLCDFLLGIVTYSNRKLEGSEAKNSLVKQLSHLTKHNLTESTPPWETKFNLFHFVPRES